jgi:CRISPR-associated protein Csm2
MNGNKNPHQNRGQEQGKKDKTFTELAEDAFKYFGMLKNEIFQFEKSSKIDELFQKTEEFVKSYGKDVTTHQLRNIYQEIKKASSLMDLKLLRPNLAYIAGRLEPKNINGKIFTAFIDSLIKEVKESDEVENFKSFMESVVAYHKFHHGSNK